MNCFCLRYRSMKILLKSHFLFLPQYWLWLIGLSLIFGSQSSLFPFSPYTVNKIYNSNSCFRWDRILLSPLSYFFSFSFFMCAPLLFLHFQCWQVFWCSWKECLFVVDSLWWGRCIVFTWHLCGTYYCSYVKVSRSLSYALRIFLMINHQLAFDLTIYQLLVWLFLHCARI